MARIWLHLGMMKTGTSAMQEWFAAHRGQLAQGGLQYVTGGGKRSACGNLAEALSKGGTAATEKLSIIRDTLAHELQPDVLISAEAFSHFGPQAMQPLIATLAGHELHFLIWLRRQDRFAEALFKQQAKWGGALADYSGFFNAAMLRRLDYAAMLASWQALYPQVQLHAHIYDEPEVGIQPDSIAAMLCALGRSDLIPEDSQSHRANISPHADMVALYNQVLPDQARALRRSNRQIMKEFGQQASGRDDMFPEAFVAQLMQHVESSNRRLHQQWFPERPALFAPRLPRYGDTAPVDPRVVARFHDLFGSSDEAIS